MFADEGLFLSVSSSPLLWVHACASILFVLAGIVVAYLYTNATRYYGKEEMVRRKGRVLSFNDERVIVGIANTDARRNTPECLRRREIEQLLSVSGRRNRADRLHSPHIQRGLSDTASDTSDFGLQHRSSATCLQAPVSDAFG